MFRIKFNSEGTEHSNRINHFKKAVLRACLVRPDILEKFAWDISKATQSHKLIHYKLSNGSVQQQKQKLLFQGPNRIKANL